ncbi:oxidoreductase [Streptomyces sp. 150FB]|uniref:Gfo/Idh/MocA family protein n=1 Tax=Streptomyces sp. 150FB TaxID=1576605 RepID=UPI0005891E44|nr:Gfo/Idh/MocA family oxidoreductase [Streptomyces sp. 150FB]KIF74600.1 oxidoreductase [Streptomyces sp. 150FB]
MSVENQQVRLGVIGLGVMGSKTLDAARSHPDYVVPFAADLGEAAVARARGAHPDVEFVSPADVIAADLDAVYIATPPASHAELAVAAMRSGKAVFCEKPLAVSLADGRLMLEAAAETGAVNAVNFPLSSTPATVHIEQSLRAGEVGDVRGIDIQLTFPVWPRPFQAPAVWVGERAEGGFVREVLSHFAYLTDRLAGPLTAVDVNLEFPADPNTSERTAHGLLTAGDTPVHISGQAGVAAPETYEWTLWGTRRSYLLRAWRDLFTSDGGPWTPVDLPPTPTRSESARLTSFAQAIRGLPYTNLADFASAFRTQQAVEAFHTS